MARISSSIDSIKEHYTVVVVGSGYGGGISASRLARATRQEWKKTGQVQVCVLERGKEFLPGEFPDTLPEATVETQANTSAGSIGSKTGLFDFHIHDDINVLVGCGLGGTSLINANVVIEADPRVFEDAAWPKALVNDLPKGIATGYKHAREMLKPNPYPETEEYPPLKKLEGLKQSAQYITEDFYRPDLAVTFEQYEGDKNHVGVKQTPCIRCGDCCSGCNYTSKNTVQMNYLPDARNHGAQVFVEVNVRYIEKQGEKWLVNFEVIGADRHKLDTPHLSVSADVVVLAAGTLGSTEILLRSKQKGLSLSDVVGRRFTGNGDVLAFGYNTDQEINAIGWGTRKPDHDNPVGPTITGIIDTRKNSRNYKDGMSIEEGAIPGALSPALPFAFAALSKFIGKDMDEGFVDYLKEKKRELESLMFGSYRGAIDNTETYLVMTHDSGNGVMELKEDRLRIKWPGVAREKIFQKVQDRLKQVVKALGGTYMPNPIQSEFLGGNLITVHPLGGSIMGEDATSGVVNHKGQVFASNTGDLIHKGLYVSDGSVIPTPLGTNPLLTISAIAERNVAMLAEDYGWEINYDLPSQSPPSPAPPKVGIQFTETMSGFFSSQEKDSCEEGNELGKSEGSTFRFILEIHSDDLNEMMENDQHEARMSGTVNAPALSSEALTVTEGMFSLFVTYPGGVDAKRMRYRMKLSSQEGKTYYFEGFKVVRADPGLHLWDDMTSLYITVHEGETANAPVLGKGMLIIRPTEFMKQMTTMKVLNAQSLSERLEYTAKFGRLFAGALFDTYGGLFAGRKYFNPDAPPRKRRVLAVRSGPEVHDFKTLDDIQLRLTRYGGGPKGPVILSHGLGVSSRIFSMDTFDTNLLEYLVAHRYDVWLLDYRASIELPVSSTQFSADEIARYDYPMAVDRVRRITGADSVQMVVHCYGSIAWTMSMLGGWLDGVRSAVCSQVSTHMKVPCRAGWNTGLHIPAFLDKLGIESLTAYVAENASWLDKFFDDAARVYPVQGGVHCSNTVCRRIALLYGQLYEHDQLNELTHENLHEMFGLANISAFEHLALLSRKGHVVDVRGEESYLPHLERMAIPITFISGGENECFLPESTEITYNLLRERNGKGLYKRFVVPNYGHIDCIFGKNAAKHVYPLILNHLDETNA